MHLKWFQPLFIFGKGFSSCDVTLHDKTFNKGGGLSIRWMALCIFTCLSSWRKAHKKGLMG